MRGIAAGRGANAPANAPIIGSPLLISSSLELPSDNLPGRPRTHDTNEQADEHELANERASPATDEALEEQRIIEIFRRIRLLSDDRRFLHLSANAWNHRAHLLDWYREGGFLKDLADGRHDGFAEALGNQEHDSYYSDLWKRISGSSAQAAAALNQRVQPHRKPRIALTIPPKYEPSDLPLYTETVSPPSYSAELPEGHVSKEVPLCTALDCPLRVYGIEHTQGLYHHNGQVGPKIHSGDNYLPSFGQSNPPPNVWNAYNLLILDINTSYQANLVKAFVRLHGRPWTAPEDNKESPVNKEISNPTSGGSKKKHLNHVDRWMQDQARRIPRYSYDAPRVAAEPVPLDEARLMDILNARTNLPQLPENESFEAVLERNTTHHPYPATHHHQQAGHRHGTVQVQTAQIHRAPIHLPGIGEVIDQGLVPTPLVTGRLHVVNPDVVEEETVDRQQSIRFADEMDGDANDGR